MNMKKKFYQMSPAERLDFLDLKSETRQILEETVLDVALADNLIENQISEFELPMGLAQNLSLMAKIPGPNGNRRTFCNCSCE
ncbi:hypothetical protein N568_0106580 [Lactococcus garvieae TRF1]|uniref:Uncharacterized protein n=1 Tax=Lactococcus garvieae TRF1 TaxID=1380772 RepID=V8ANV5_9LACT|nr:hypothetical protein N568_0106580 [Lactococcus garvieae TRF1]